MNQENFDLWCNALTSGAYPQAKGYLKRGGGYCCLGVGCKVMGLDQRGPISGIVQFRDPADVNAEDWFESMPPLAFHVWLGTLTQEQADRLRVRGTQAADVRINWPDDIKIRGDGNDPLTSATKAAVVNSCSGLNDQGFTFSQIVDLMRHFGISCHAIIPEAAA